MFVPFRELMSGSAMIKKETEKLERAAKDAELFKEMKKQEMVKQEVIVK